MKSSESKEFLKQIIREIEKLIPDLKDGIKFGELSVLLIMLYSYLEPVK